MPGRNNTFFAIDFDRCLGDVGALYEQLVDTIIHLGYANVEELHEVRSQVEASGGSFDAIAYLRETAGEEAVNSVIAAYLHATVDMARFLLPGARELLDWLAAEKIPHGIMTYGGEEWQRAKIRRAGCGNVSTLVTRRPQKGEIIASWYDHQRGVYQVPEEYNAPGAIASIVLVDDKATAFNGLEGAVGSRGYWVRPSGAQLLASQSGDVPTNVRIVQSLHNIVNYEQNILT